MIGSSETETNDPACVKKEIISSDDSDEETDSYSDEETDSNSDEETNSSSDEETDSNSDEETESIESENAKLPTKNKGLSGMNATQLRDHLETDFIKFCQDHGLVSMTMTCRCGKQMALSHQKKTSDNALWRCRKKPDHRVTVTIRKGTWFENSRLKIPEILWIAYMWVYEYSYKSMLHETDNSAKTIVDWCTCCRDSCQPILEFKSEPLGGSINLVEVFECEFLDDRPGKKRKRKEKGRWVFFGVEQFSTKNAMVVADNKNSKTIVEIFDKYILPGTTVFGNAWNAYQRLTRQDFFYLTIDRSLTFFDLVSKTDMTTVEELWKASKRESGKVKNELSSQFCEYVYRKSLRFAKDAYLEFLKDISKIYPPHNCVDFVESILPH